MSTTKKISLILGGLIFICLFTGWFTNSPWVSDMILLYRRDTDDDLAIAFSVALRLNSPEAYKMVDPRLAPLIDDWMNTHEVQKCRLKADDVLTGRSGAPDKQIPNGGYYDLSFGCLGGEQDFYVLYMQDIHVADGKILGWGKIEESK